jgi:hypothetical protein
MQSIQIIHAIVDLQTLSHIMLTLLGTWIGLIMSTILDFGIVLDNLLVW